MNWQIRRLSTVDSTMLEAADLPVGSVVVAEAQTSGIGRHGHGWDSQLGAGLYASFVMRPHPVLTLALGLATQAAMLDATRLECDIRWPNDLMLSRKKIGGILVQSQDDRAVSGIGINLGQRAFPQEIGSIATSAFLETGLEFLPDDVLNALLKWIPRFIEFDTRSIVTRWEQASTWAHGKPVTVDLGNSVVEGVTCGLDASGFLRVRMADARIETILAGGVRERVYNH